MLVQGCLDHMTGTGMGGTDQRSCATPYIQDCTQKVTTVCGAAGMDVAADWFERCAAPARATRYCVVQQRVRPLTARAAGGLGVNACVRACVARVCGQTRACNDRILRLLSWMPQLPQSTQWQPQLHRA